MTVKMSYKTIFRVLYPTFYQSGASCIDVVNCPYIAVIWAPLYHSLEVIAKAGLKQTVFSLS